MSLLKRARVLGAEQVPTEVGRSRSLRSQWRRAFGLLIGCVLIAESATFVGNQALLASSRASAGRVEAEAIVSVALRTDLVAESIVLASPITASQAPGITAVEARIQAEFSRAVSLERSPAARSSLEHARASWQLVVAAVGSLQHPNPVTQRALAVTTNVPMALLSLDQAGAASGAAINADMDHTARLSQEVLAILAFAGLMTIALALGLGRRLFRQVLIPVGALRDAANSLANGRLDHRVTFDRNDELGDLAASFNTMADAIAGSQRNLTLEASTDSLSGLANRPAFRGRLQAMLDRPDRQGGRQAVLFVDLDDFKDVNDTLGHAAGDELLRVVAARLTAVVRPGDTVARLGGDEFALLLDNLTEPDLAVSIAHRVVNTLADPVAIGSTWAHVGASVGVALRRPDSTLDAMMHEADLAMYTAKGKGKNRAELYDLDIDERAATRHILKSDIGAAAASDQLLLDYQPIVDLRTGALIGVEALVRWQHPTLGLLPPAIFIELAEDTGDILGLGAWVLSTASRQLRSWQARYGKPDLYMSVNVSVRQLDAPGFATQVKAVLGAVGIAPHTLTLEVTESVLANPGGLAATALSELRGLGVRVALDDFGTGYSSIGYLRRLPIDAIKIDRSFVSGTHPGGPENALLEAIVAMAQRLGLGVIPEGIEELEQLIRLREMGCQIGQGFLLSRPVPPTAIDALLDTPLPLPHVALSQR